MIDHLLKFHAVPNKPTNEKEWDRLKLDWTDKLAKIPRWKLIRADEFTGKFITDIWEFFESLKVPEQKIVFDEERTEKSNIAKDCLNLYRQMDKAMQYKPKYKHSKDPEKYMAERKKHIEKKRKIEREGLKALHKKYPNAGFDHALRMRGL